MSTFFDSPIEYCPVANRYVLLDQTAECCRAENGCPQPDCPLARFFAAWRPGDATARPASGGDGGNRAD